MFHEFNVDAVGILLSFGRNFRLLISSVYPMGSSILFVPQISLFKSDSSLKYIFLSIVVHVCRRSQKKKGFKLKEICQLIISILLNSALFEAVSYLVPRQIQLRHYLLEWKELRVFMKIDFMDNLTQIPCVQCTRGEECWDSQDGQSNLQAPSSDSHCCGAHCVKCKIRFSLNTILL